MGRGRDRPPPSAENPAAGRPVLIQVGLTAILVLGLVAVAGTVEARRTAEQEAVENPTDTTGILGARAASPNPRSPMTCWTRPETLWPPAYARLDGIVRNEVLRDTVVRVELSSTGRTVVISTRTSPDW